MSAHSFWQYAQLQPQPLALVAPDGRHWSRGELFAECNRIVHGLRQLGLRAGDVVAAALPNCAEYIALNLAVTQAGWLLVPINWHLAGPEMAYLLRDSGAKAFLTHQRIAAAATAAVAQADFPLRAAFALGDVPGFRAYHELTAGQPAALPVDRATGAGLFYTSGTTGNPKGVSRALPDVDPDTAAARFTLLLQLFGIERESGNVHFCGSPLYHTGVMTWATNSLHFGHSVVMQDKWDAEGMLDLIDRFQVTTAHVVPTQFVRLLKLPDAVRSRYRVRSMRHMLHTAAPCAPEIKRAVIDWFGPCLYEYYAATEGGGAVCNSDEWLANPGTVGRAWPGAELKILDENGRELPVGEQGTVYMKMSEVSRFEYRGDSDKTAKNRVGDFFTAGDVGYLNESGFLFLCDRKIDMIISGGANIYPAEIENVLILHPQVSDCCVFGVPHDEWGEEIKAVVQPMPGVAADAALTADILQFCAERLARMKWPKSIDYMAELPRDPNGKLYKRRLRGPYWENRMRQI